MAFYLHFLPTIFLFTVRYSNENVLNVDPSEQRKLEEEKPSCGEQLSQEAAHLFREVCECGKRTFLYTSRKSSEESFEKLLSSAPKNQPIPDTLTDERRMEKLSTMFIIVVTIFAIFFLFWVRNFDFKMRSASLHFQADEKTFS